MVRWFPTRTVWIMTAILAALILAACTTQGDVVRVEDALDETEPADTPQRATQAPPSNCTYAASFVEDVSIPDRTAINGGAAFTKIWRISNSGCQAWGPGVSFDRVAGNPMGASGSEPLPFVVDPGDTLDMSIDMIAPDAPGEYTTTWQLRAPDGSLFGPRFVARINSVAAGTMDTYVTVWNQAGVQICAIYVSPSSDTAWGDPDWSGTLYTGNSITVYDLWPDSWDIRVDDCSGGTLETAYEMWFEGPEVYTTYGEGSTENASTDLTIENQSGDAICQVYVSLSSDTTWGNPDWTGTLYYDDVVTIYGLWPDYWDLSLRDCSGNVIEESFNFWIEGAQWYTAYGSDPGTGASDLTIENQSAATICEVYVSASSDTTWGPADWTGTLYYGDTVTIYGLWPDYWDLKLVACGGATLYEEYSLWVEGSSWYTYYGP